MINRKSARQDKNKSSIRSGAWTVSLIAQLVAIGITVIIALSFGPIWIGLVALLAVGFMFLTKSTIELIKGKITNTDSISTLTAFHLVAFVLSCFVIAAFLAFYTGTKF